MTKRVMVALATVGVLAAAPAAAQVNFDNYCVAGSFQVCASVRLTMSDATHLRMQVWNLEGLMGDFHTITSVGLYHSGLTQWDGRVNGFSVTHVVSPDSSLDISSEWSKRGAGDIKTLPGGLEATLREGTTGSDGIIGCTEIGGGLHWNTCQSFAGMPWVEFNFALSKSFSLDGVQLAWHSQQLPDGSSVKCLTEGGENPCTPAVPEPVTLALLGTGLLGMGGMGLVRRRRKGGNIENV